MPLALRRRQRAAAWPFREELRWTGPGLLPPAAAVAGAGVGLYTGIFEHLRAGGAAWSVGIGLALLAPPSLALVAATPAPGWRAALGVLLFGAAFELAITLGLHLGTRPQTLSISLPTIALVQLGLAAVLLVQAARRLRSRPRPDRGRTAARLAAGLAVAAATLCLTSALLAKSFDVSARRRRALAARVEADVAPFVRREVAALLPATWDEQGWTPARRAPLERLVGPKGTVATSVGAGDEERLESAREPRKSRAIPPQIEAPRRGAERRALVWYGAWGGAFRHAFDPRLQEGEVDGLAFTSCSSVSSLPEHLTVRGRLVGPDGTPYDVTVLWEDLRPMAGGPALDDLLGR